MTPHDLLANFETLAEAPNGVQRLRELVLELAVRGKLVEQNPAEGMAQHQFPNLCSGRPQSNSPKRGRQLKGPDAPEPAPDDLPGNSIWVPLGHLMDLYNGRAFKPNEWATTGLPIIRIQNLNDPSSPFNFCNFEVPEKVHVHDGDLLISWSGTPGTSFGAFIWTRGHAVLNQHIFRVELRHPKLVPEYIRLSVNARLDEMISRAHGGVGLRHITKGELEAIGIPIPPEAEQRRIIARVDDLMALLDRLEAKRQDREAARTAARDSALAALREAPTPDDVETTWLRIQERFGDLFATPEDVEPLRALTLELAVRGKLVEQDLNDEPAPNLVMRAKARKSKISGSGRQARSSPETEAEWPFDIPNGWSWARMDDFCDIKSGVAKGKNFQGVECKDFPYLRVANVQAGYTDLAVIKTMPLPVEELDAYCLVKGDVLLTEGGDWDKLGRSAVWSGEIDPCIHQNHVFRARSLDQGIHPRWISCFTNSPDGRAYFQSCAKQTTNLASINMTQLKGCLVPIPPSAEQDRILARMDELMGLLDRLSESLSGQSRLAQAFAAAAIHHLDA